MIDALPANERALSRTADAALASVICLSYNRRDYVLDLLSALQHQTYPSTEVIVVDNNSQDGTAAAVGSAFPHTRLIRCPHNFGMVAYNIGLANATGQYVFVVDDDGLPADDTWIADGVAHFEANPQLGALACTIRMADTGSVAHDNPQHTPDDVKLGGYPAAAYNGTGAGLRASALQDTGYYPFHFFRSWLELSLCTKLIDAGWEVRYFPDMEVWHRRPSGSVHRPVTYYGLRNYFWYVWTFYPRRQAISETVRYFAYCLKLMPRGQMPVRLFARAWSNACTGWWRIRGTRKPVSRSTVAHLHRIRQGQRCSSLLPEQRDFHLETMEQRGHSGARALEC